MDIHDISRSAMTYGVEKFFIIHPNKRQKEIFDKVLMFWKTEVANFYNPHRVDALSVINFSESLEETINKIKNQENNDPLIITTTAKYRQNQISFKDTKKLLKSTDNPVLLLFGTGNGLHEDIHNLAGHVLVPIRAKTNYNHLSVRSAVAIILDRLFSDEYKEEP
jgi:hypothetical protein